MIEHIVLFKLKPEATHVQVDAMIAALRGLKDQIDVIVEASAGRNFSDRSQGHAVGLRVLFNSREDLAIYAPHPAHKACVETYIRPIAELFTVVDYETD